MRRPWASGIALLLGLAALAPASMTLARFTDAAISSGSFVSDTLAPPTGLAATGGASVTLTWTPTVDGYATGYDVRRAATSGGPYTAVGSVVPGSATTTTDSPTAGTWFYVLRSAFQAWRSVDSDEAFAVVVTSVSTAFVGCTAGSTAADTVNAGDDNGYQSNPNRACVDDGSVATDSNSGTGGSQSCGTGATPDVRKDRHRFWGFATGLPGTVTSIDGIRVRADLGMNNNGGSTNVCVQLSWDGGTTWTTMGSHAISGTALATYTYGSTSDTWGRDWAVGDFSPASFRVRVIDASTQANKQFRLDDLAVSVTYTP